MWGLKLPKYCSHTQSSGGFRGHRKVVVGWLDDKNNSENKSKAAFKYQNVPYVLGGSLETGRHQRDGVNLEDFSISFFICGTKGRGPDHEFMTYLVVILSFLFNKTISCVGHNNVVSSGHSIGPVHPLSFSKSQAIHEAKA